MVCAAVSGFAFADLVVAAVEAGLSDAFGLKKSAKVFFGEADGLAAGDASAVTFAFRDFFSPGDGDASVAAAVGAGVAKAVFFRAAFDAGSINGWVLGVAEAIVAAGDASVAAAIFLRDFFAGDVDASAPADSAGEASGVVAFLRDFLPGEADVSAAGDPLGVADASAAAAFLRECLAGDAEGDGVGDCP